VARGANDKLTPREVETRLATIGASTFVYLSGYSLVNSPQREAVLETVKFANKKSSRIVFDVASSNLARSHSNIFTSAIESCHFLCANLDEASVLANGLPIAEYARRQSRNGRIVIVKMGANGCLVAEDGKSMEVPGFKVTSIDTTGAGDSFLGAVLYCLSRKIPLVKAALFGNWFASQLTSGIGARNYPEIEKTQQEYERLVA
jgi:sugar/nucleoside kinase (ribokinase family)